MKNFFRNILFIILILTPLSAFAEQVYYTLDPKHSYATWSVDHFGYSHVTGKFFIEGVIIGNVKNPTRSGVSVVIPVATLNTGIKELDEILLGRSFFDGQNFPSASFKSHKIEMTGKDTAKIYGTLTIRNVWAPVVLDVKLRKRDMHPYHHKEVISFVGSTSIKRSDFGMLGYLPGISDHVYINIEIEAIRAPSDKSENKAE